MGREREEVSKEYIFRLVLERIAEVGLPKMAVDTIAWRYEISVGRLYRAFPGRNALLAATYDDFLNQLDRSLRIGGWFGPPRKQLAKLWQRLESHFAHNKGQAFLELAHARTSFSTCAATRHGSELPSLLEFVQTGQLLGAFKPAPPRVLSTAIWSLFTGCIGASGAGALDLNRTLLAASCDCCWDALRIHADEPFR